MHFRARIYFKGRRQALQNLEGVADKEGGLTDLEFILGGAREKGVRSVFQGGADTLEETMFSTYIEQ